MCKELFVIIRSSFGDFDIIQTTPIKLWSTKELAENHVKELEKENLEKLKIRDEIKNITVKFDSENINKHNSKSSTELYLAKDKLIRNFLEKNYPSYIEEYLNDSISLLTTQEYKYYFKILTLD